MRINVTSKCADVSNFVAASGFYKFYPRILRQLFVLQGWRRQGGMSEVIQEIFPVLTPEHEKK